MLGVIRALFMGVGSQLVTTVLALESVTQGAERYPSPQAYQWAVDYPDYVARLLPFCGAARCSPQYAHRQYTA